MDTITAKFLIYFFFSFSFSSPSWIKWATVLATKQAYTIFPNNTKNNTKNNIEPDYHEKWLFGEPKDKNNLLLSKIFLIYNPKKIKEIFRLFAYKREFVLLKQYDIPYVFHHWDGNTKASKKLMEKWSNNWIVCCNPECLPTPVKQNHIFPSGSGTLYVKATTYKSVDEKVCMLFVYTLNS